MYDNSANLLVELHKILDSSAEYTLNFSGTSPMDVEYLIRRPVSLTFRTASYGQARNIINQLHDSENTNAISDLSVTFNGNTNEILYWNQLDGNDEDYPISVSMTITYYERLENK